MLYYTVRADPLRALAVGVSEQFFSGGLPLRTGRLRVEFEVPVPESEAPSREQDTLSTLRELGISDDASAT